MCELFDRESSFFFWISLEVQVLVHPLQKLQILYGADNHDHDRNPIQKAKIEAVYTFSLCPALDYARRSTVDFKEDLRPMFPHRISNLIRVHKTFQTLFNFLNSQVGVNAVFAFEVGDFHIFILK